jgi:hypothetical protein
LGDEKIVWQVRLRLIKKKMPGLAPGIFILKAIVKDRAISGL